MIQQQQQQQTNQWVLTAVKFNLVLGFPQNYTVSSSGGVKASYPAYLGLYKKTDQLANFPGECYPNLPIYKQESAEYYLFVNCHDDWVINSHVHPTDADVFAEKSSMYNTPPSSGWEYWQNGDVKTDSTMKVVKGKGKGSNMFSFKQNECTS